MVGIFMEVVFISSVGVVLLQFMSSIMLLSGLVWIDFFIFMLVRLWQSMVVGCSSVLFSDIMGNFSGKLLVFQMLILICLFRVWKCELQGVSLEQVLQMLIIGWLLNWLCGMLWFFIQEWQMNLLWFWWLNQVWLWWVDFFLVLLVIVVFLVRCVCKCVLCFLFCFMCFMCCQLDEVGSVV